VLVAVLAAAPVAAQPPARGGPRVPPPNPAPTDFQILSWVSTTPAGGSLIRAPKIDLTARDDDSQITVYGHKKRPDVGPRPDVGYEPLFSDAAIPQVIPIGPVSSCSNGAYNTIAGQPANGRDLQGALGGGRC
jgi:hypothetical protein